MTRLHKSCLWHGLWDGGWHMTFVWWLWLSRRRTQAEGLLVKTVIVDHGPGCHKISCKLLTKFDPNCCYIVSKCYQTESNPIQICRVKPAQTTANHPFNFQSPWTRPSVGWGQQGHPKTMPTSATGGMARRLELGWKQASTWQRIR